MTRWARLNFKFSTVMSAVFAFSSLVVSVSARADFEDVPVSGGENTQSGKPSEKSGPELVPTKQPTPESAEAPPGVGQRMAEPPASSGQPGQPPKASAKPKQTSNQTNADAGLAHKSSDPVSYSAQSLEGSLSEGKVLLKGDVVIEQGDALMKSDAAEIFSAKGTTSASRAVAKGRVSLFKAATPQSAELRAVASELEYFMPIRKVLLKGKPKIWRGRELLQGEVIEVFLATNEIKVRGARGVMDPSTGTSPVGNTGSSGVQSAPAKKSSGQNRR